MNREQTYKVSERITLKRGDFFKVRGGPYYIGEDGKRQSMAVRGLVVFMYHCKKEDDEWIEAWSVSESSYVVLSLNPNRESIIPGSFFPEPYWVKGGVSKARQEKLIQKAGGKKMLPAARGRRGGISSPKKPQKVSAPSTLPGIESGKEIMKEVFSG